MLFGHGIVAADCEAGVYVVGGIGRVPQVGWGARFSGAVVSIEGAQTAGGKDGEGEGR